ncbi:MAG: alpha/beta hydrolase-fold protein [Verrucomicrobiales bacterium]|nr:alpha/beta hydrolase-fold protein [Verrucomicrobiales bacterium]
MPESDGMRCIILFAASLACFSLSAQDQKPKAKKKKKPAPFSWVSPLSENAAKQLTPGTRHGTFRSASMGIDVGYYIYLPPGYDDSEQSYPVVYHLHGGRPGGEGKSVKLAKYVDDAIRSGSIQPTIYVFPNGGPMSWYNYPQKKQALGEDIFINETIPHIDKKYRTIAKREGRGLQGFSQGGRGATRIMFKHPELWGSTAPGGSGYEPEKRIQENNGAESETVVFAPGYNAWDLAKAYSERNGAPLLRPMIWVGTKGFNYEFNLKFMTYLDELGIPYEKLIVPGATHSPIQIYDSKGLELMSFHDRNFKANLAK